LAPARLVGAQALARLRLNVSWTSATTRVRNPVCLSRPRFMCDYPRCTRMARNTGDLTDREVAKALRKSVRTVQRWCESGKLSDAYKAGRSWRIPERSLDAVHRDAVRRLARDPLGDVIEEMRATSAQLRRATNLIADADARAVEDLRSALDALTAGAKAAGNAALERRKRLEFDLRRRGQSHKP